MKLLKNKQDLIELIGPKKELELPLYSDVEYIGGWSVLDSYFRRNEAASTSPVFYKHQKGLAMMFQEGWSKKVSVALQRNGVNYWAFEKQEQIVEKKSKSIVGRALIGGILLGPAGAIVGGMTGIGDKEKKTGHENILTISYTDADEERLFLFSCKNKKAKAVQEYFHRVLSDKYVDEIPEPPVQSEPPTTTLQKSVADEIGKLKSLMDSGALTEQEFTSLKAGLIEKFLTESSTE